MRISDIFKPRNLGSTETSTVAGSAKEQRGRQETSQNGEDSVTISSLSRQLSQVGKILDEDSEQRKSKVAEIKAKVDAGTYDVSSEDIARSIVQYARDNQGR